MILIQDVNSFKIVEKAVKNNEELIETNKFISSQLKKPLTIIANVTDKLLDPQNPDRPKHNDTLKSLRAVKSSANLAKQFVDDLKDSLSIMQQGFQKKEACFNVQ